MPFKPYVCSMPHCWPTHPVYPQVLSPTKRLPGGVHSLNIMLQQVLNPEAKHLAEMPLPAKLVPRHLAKAGSSDKGSSGPQPVWRVGDRVLHLKNNADEVRGCRGWAGVQVHGGA
jgi:ATP-dependent exoDNAse (exonuclease V) alpha subunit